MPLSKELGEFHFMLHLDSPAWEGEVQQPFFLASRTRLGDWSLAFLSHIKKKKRETNKKNKDRESIVWGPSKSIFNIHLMKGSWEVYTSEPLEIPSGVLKWFPAGIEEGIMEQSSPLLSWRITENGASILTWRWHMKATVWFLSTSITEWCSTFLWFHSDKISPLEDQEKVFLLIAY